MNVKITDMLKDYGVSKIFTSWDFTLSLLSSFIVTVLCYYLNWTAKAIDVLVPIFIPTAGVFITIVIAGLAIIVSLADPNFVRILKKVDSYNKLLILFYITSCISGLCIIVNILTLLLKAFVSNDVILIALLWSSVFTFLYSLYSVIYVTGTVVVFGVYRGLFIEIDQSKIEEFITNKK